MFMKRHAGPSCHTQNRRQFMPMSAVTVATAVGKLGNSRCDCAGGVYSWAK